MEFSPTVVGAGSLLALAATWLLPLLSKIKLPSLTSPTPPPTPDDADVLDLQAAKRLAARYERNKCQEGKAAMDICLTHFFHVGP